MDKRLTILIAPLDWGLGHATRCVPLINELNAMGHRVIIGASGSGFTYLQTVFPYLEIIRLKDYKIKYFRNPFFTYLYNAFNLPYRIWQDRKALSVILKIYDVDLIISDNRFGFYCNSISSVCVTHQLNIQHPNGWVKRLINHLNEFILNKYNEIWVVDDYKTHFAGDLSTSSSIAKKFYLGLLPSIEAEESDETTNQFLLILSGPEPMKSIWLNEVCCHFLEWGKSLSVVGEATKIDQRYLAEKSIKLLGLLDGKELANTIAQSEFIIARSGYSTLMDLSGFGKKLILIPTPYQTEQIYLANYFQTQGWATWIKQKDLNARELTKMMDRIVPMPKFVRHEKLELFLAKRLKKLM